MQRRNALLLPFALLSGSACGQGWQTQVKMEPAQAKSATEKKILSVLNRMEASGGTYLDVGSEGGRLLRLLAENMGAKNVVEIGTSTGYSGLWMAMALSTTGGKLTTFEIDAKRAAQARANFREAGVEGLVTVIEGDAHEKAGQVKGPIDLLFLDADKEGYGDYLAKLLPLVRPGGLIVADNLGRATEYAANVMRNPELETVVTSQRMGVTLKKR
jgi:predicted O-methyltransferase YrrM